jgi:hypothetical protein
MFIGAFEDNQLFFYILIGVRTPTSLILFFEQHTDHDKWSDSFWIIIAFWF